MVDFTLQALQATDDPLEKAAIVAEAVFSLLPAETALVARRCVIFHWFDLPIVEALLEESELTIDEMNTVYEQLATLPFVDTIPQGLTFQDLTREGLLKRYSLTQPELLQTAAHLAAPAYEAREEDEKNIAEAFFCYVIAGNQRASMALQNVLFEKGSSDQDWHCLENILRLQDEAEQLLFVQPIPRTEQQFLLRGFIHRVSGKQDAALLDYNQALALNPKSTLAYISRGTTYAEQGNFDKALNDYNTAIRLDKAAAQAYVSRGVIHTKQARYTEALKDFDKAVEVGLSNGLVFRHKGEVLNELGRYEEALAAYDEALRFNSADVEAYRGKGHTLNSLERYVGALVANEVAYLKQVDIFASLSDEDIRELMSVAKQRTFRSGEAIFHRDDPGQVLYVIKEGKVKISLFSPDGQEISLVVFGKGECFGELALLDGEARSADAIALERVQCYMLQRSDFHNAIMKNPKIAIKILEVLSRRLRTTNQMVEDLIFLDVYGRVAKKLLELAETHGTQVDDGVRIDVRLTQQDLASMVGASRESVNKVMGYFTDKKFISTDKHKITLHRTSALKRRIY